MTNRLVLGFFDGIHSAHMEVIKSANKSRDDNTKVILLTFKESPSLYFNNTAEYIMTRENSINKAMSIGVDEVIEQNFKECYN